MFGKDTQNGQTFALNERNEFNLSTLISDTADGSQGFVIYGIDEDDESGLSVSGAGDVNGDGIDDLIVGAPYSGPNDNYSGETYVVFGKRTHDENGLLVNSFGTEVELTGLDGSNGFVINGIDADDESGYSVSSAGDVNNDGYDDMIIGAPQADDGNNAGETYVVYGQASYRHGTLDLATMLGLEVQLYVAEGSTGADVVYTANAIDIESDDVIITYDLGNAKDEAFFNIDTETGAVTFQEAPDHENPLDGEITEDGAIVSAANDNAYVIDIIASGANNTTTTKTVIINVTDIYEAPVFTSGDSGNIDENSLAVVYTAETNFDGDTITYSLGDTQDEHWFNINAETGAVTFQEDPDYENPLDSEITEDGAIVSAAGNNHYIIDIIAEDGNGVSTRQTVTIEVNDATNRMKLVSTGHAVADGFVK